MTHTMDFLAPLDDLAVLRIEGEDAVEFLHAQLSNDISGMPSDTARLAAYCNPKGRMLGSLLVWRETEQPSSALLALVKADLLEPLLKRLRMFVLRAKVSFSQAALRVYGASLSAQSNSGHAALASWAAEQAWKVQRTALYTLISAPATIEAARAWVIASDEQATSELGHRLGLSEHEASAWQAQEIRAGLGWVEHANLELFIPQSLNYDLNGGVNFTKGCYPGQEVVARAHYRGAVKRRGLPGECSLDADASLEAGMDLYDAARPGAAAGRIINAVAEPNPAGGTTRWQVFIEVNLNDVEQVDFRALSSEGPPVRLLPLPYSLEPRS